MTYVTVFNGSDTPVVVSDDGRTVGGGEWGTALSTDDAVKEALDDSRLVKVTPPDGDGDVNPDARTAFDRTALFTTRSEAVSSWDKATLEGFAASTGLTPAGEDDDRGVVELRRLITESNVELPSKSAAKKTAQAHEQSSN